MKLNGDSLPSAVPGRNSQKGAGEGSPARRHFHPMASGSPLCATPLAMTSLLTASLDGSDERVLASYKRPEGIYPHRVAWSPDGKTLAFIHESPAAGFNHHRGGRRSGPAGGWRTVDPRSVTSLGSLEAVTCWLLRPVRGKGTHSFTKSHLTEAKSGRSPMTFRGTGNPGERGRKDAAGIAIPASYDPPGRHTGQGVRSQALERREPELRRLCRSCMDAGGENRLFLPG